MLSEESATFWPYPFGRPQGGRMEKPQTWSVDPVEFSLVSWDFRYDNCGSENWNS